MLHVSKDGRERYFTFRDIAKFTNMTANYFSYLGIKRGDKVMLVLKRHFQFWFSILALHKIGAIAIPATNLLTRKDFEYRFKQVKWMPSFVRQTAMFPVKWIRLPAEIQH